MGKVSFTPLVRGQLYTFTILPSKKKTGSSKPQLKYIVMDPILGEITMYKSEHDFANTVTKNSEFIKM